MAKADLTASRLRDLLHYDPETGVFTWVRPTSNRVKPGSQCQTIGPLGYIVIGVDGVRHYAHRLAWLYMTGGFPVEMIDHSNGRKTDNRWRNLRAASKSQNMRNAGQRANSTSGYTGVGWHKRSAKWRAYIELDGKSVHLGLFDSAEEALVARETAAKREYGPFHWPQEI